MVDRPKVAVIGAGVLGLVTLKNLLEEGFDAVTFEKNDYVGGLWHFTEDEEITSGTENTTWNSCRQMSCYTDYPFPPDYPDFPSIAQVQSYVESYCDHFSLLSHIRLGHSVKGVSRVNDDTQWRLDFVDQAGVQHEEIFDRLVMAHGQTGARHMPVGIEGLENFKGKVIHGQAFKRGIDFKDKRVLILGSSNTAMDCAADLDGIAEKIYLSHRSGGLIVPRYHHNMPVEFYATIKLQAIGRILDSISPSLWAYIFNRRVMHISNHAFGTLDSKWRFSKPPPGRMSNPIINDRIVDILRKGEVSIVQSLHSILPSGEAKLSDGQTISDIDTIILCTGYIYDYSLFDESISPISIRNPKWDASRASGNRSLQRLYQGIFSLEYPESLAFIGASHYPSSQMPLCDLVSMALAQVWKGAYPLPSREVMEDEVNQRQAWLVARARAKEGPSVLPGEMKSGPWMQWLHEAAGTGVTEKLSYTLRGWWYWLTNMSYCNFLMTSVNTPHIWRLFDGRRKKWEGAEEAIRAVNTDAAARMKSASLNTKKST
ncbi:hypothetical protein BP6252_02969 [Coleophoma cylindrospora]|uniref:Dimethylaniline monooxygenase 2 n=1 Tax=Coleophoma cylindrospora TaxID=1849047 RepID=A0A3D8S6B4_9HELO|nr:hypothetical protein BP6252_02969 [Coleophoma cylindrospora]